MTRLLWIVCACFAMGGVLMALGNRSVNAEQRRSRWIKFAVYFAIVLAVLGSAALGRGALGVLVLAISLQGARELAGALRHAEADGSRLFAVSWGAYVAFAGAALAAAVLLEPRAVAFVYVVVAAFDGFSQTVGQLCGRRRLAPQVSPGKTMEGAMGGFGGAILVAMATRELWPALPATAVTLAAILGLAALAGDLGASLVKRRCGIKDYGVLLPRHGGVLDRFDGFLPALALAGPLSLALAS